MLTIEDGLLAAIDDFLTLDDRLFTLFKLPLALPSTTPPAAGRVVKEKSHDPSELDVHSNGDELFRRDTH